MLMNNTSTKRPHKGAIASVLLLMLILTAFALCAIGLDFQHAVAAKAQLQCATDAAALAGAKDIAKTGVQPDDLNCVAAYHDAMSIAAKNKVDNVSVANSSGISVSCTVDASTMPYKVTVIAQAPINNVFGRLVGWKSTWVAAQSVAGAWQGVLVLAPNQVWNMVVSMDCTPTNGLSKGVQLESYTGASAVGQSFTIVLNPQNSKNAAWLSNWSNTSNPALTFGSTVAVLNGVQGNKVSNLCVGDVMLIPLVQGGPPFNDSRTIVGTVGFKVTSIQFPQSVTGTLMTPVMRGTPGMPLISTTDSQGNLFLTQWAPWQVKLMQ